jgi:hypothetical protein
LITEILNDRESNPGKVGTTTARKHTPGRIGITALMLKTQDRVTASCITNTNRDESPCAKKGTEALYSPPFEITHDNLAWK